MYFPGGVRNLAAKDSRSMQTNAGHMAATVVQLVYLMPRL